MTVVEVKYKGRLDVVHTVVSKTRRVSNTVAR
jgi:hypothetical protein